MERRRSRARSTPACERHGDRLGHLEVERTAGVGGHDVEREGERDVREVGLAQPRRRTGKLVEEQRPGVAVDSSSGIERSRDVSGVHRVLAESHPEKAFGVSAHAAGEHELEAFERAAKVLEPLDELPSVGSASSVTCRGTMASQPSPPRSAGTPPGKVAFLGHRCVHGLAQDLGTAAQVRENLSDRPLGTVGLAQEARVVQLGDEV